MIGFSKQSFKPIQTKKRAINTCLVRAEANLDDSTWGGFENVALFNTSFACSLPKKEGVRERVQVL